MASLDWVSPARSRVRRRGNFPGGGQVTLEITEVLDTGKVAYPPNQPVIAMPLDTPTGRFLLEIRLSRRAV